MILGVFVFGLLLVVREASSVLLFPGDFWRQVVPSKRLFSSLAWFCVWFVVMQGLHNFDTQFADRLLHTLLLINKLGSVGCAHTRKRLSKSHPVFTCTSVSQLLCLSVSLSLCLSSLSLCLSVSLCVLLPILPCEQASSLQPFHATPFLAAAEDWAR